CQQHDDSPWTF
nr:immunoglobulin light chain junction region [Macaca mulatta]